MHRKLAKATSRFSGMTLISRVLGFLRDMIVAHLFGANAYTDAFYVAFKLPNLLRRLFAEGSFSQAFVPVLSEYKIQAKPGDMETFIASLGGALAFVLFVVTLVCMICAPLIVTAFAPGFIHFPEKYELAVSMVRITFPYLFFISLTAFMAAILNTHHYFAIPALTPVFLNISMILAALYLAPHMTYPIMGLAWGVTVAGVIQFFFLLPFVHRLKLLRWPRWGWSHPGVKRVLKLMVPALFGVSLAQISILVDTLFASFLQTGSVSWLYASERLMEFPLGVFGVALSTVILPHLSQRHAEKSPTEYAATIDWAVKAVLMIGLPSAAVLAVLAGPILTSLFQYGKFSPHDVQMAQQSLIAFSLGIPFFMLIKIFAAGFYARQNIRTPTKIAGIALLMNIGLNFLLVLPLKHAGLALASSLAAVVNVGCLATLLYQQKVYRPAQSFWHFLGWIILGTAILAFLLNWVNPPLTTWMSWHAFKRLTVLAALLIGVLAFYGLLVVLLRKVYLNARGME